MAFSITDMIIPPWVKPVAILLVILGIFLSGYWKGHHDVKVEWDLAIAEAKTEKAEMKVKEEKVTTQIVIKYIDRIKTVKQKGETITKVVDHYLTKDADRQCKIPKNFIALYDAAVKNDTQFLRLAETLMVIPEEKKEPTK